MAEYSAKQESVFLGLFKLLHGLIQCSLNFCYTTLILMNMITFNVIFKSISQYLHTKSNMNINKLLFITKLITLITVMLCVVLLLCLLKLYY